MDRGTAPTFRPRAVARALAAIIALLVAGLAGFLVANDVAQINPASVAPVHLPVATAPTPPPPLLTDVGRDDLISVVTVEAELANGAEESLGTGWIFDKVGDVVTNAHVINGNESLRVTDRADTTHVARVVQSSAALDIAVLRVSGTLVGTPLPVDASELRAVPVSVITLASSKATGQADMTEETLIGLHDSVPLSGSGIDVGQSAPQEYDGHAPPGGGEDLPGQQRRTGAQRFGRRDRNHHARKPERLGVLRDSDQPGALRLATVGRTRMIQPGIGYGHH